MAKKFESILDECLRRVITRGEDIEQCLRDYPDAAEELEALLRTALAVHAKTATVRPSPRAKSLTKQRFLAEARAQQQRRRKPRWFPLFQWQRSWAFAVAAVLIVVLVGGGGTVAAATNSMPDDPLYPVKIATERARLVVTRSDMGKAELEARFANRRVNEIARMAEKRKAAKVEVAAERLSKHLDRIAKVAVAQKAKGGVSEKDIARFRNILAKYATEHPDVLKKALEKAPPQTKAVLRHILTTSKKRYAAAIQDVNIAARAKRDRQPTAVAEVRSVRGVIKMITDTQWIVNEEVVNIDPDTVIRGDPKVGFGARVEARIQRDGSLLAKRVVVKAIRTFRGVIKKISDTEWTVGAHKIAINARTAIEGEPKVGLMGVVTVRVQPDRSLLAQKIKILPKARKPAIVTFRGIIGEISNTEWTVGAHKIAINARTAIEGKPKVGLMAAVTVRVQPDKSLLAQKIRILPKRSRPTIRTFRGVIKKIGDTEWTVGARTIAINARTAIEGKPKVGLMAAVTVRVQSDKSLLAQRIKVHLRNNKQTNAQTDTSPQPIPKDVKRKSATAREPAP
jgi:hypothetical protein